MRSSFILHPSSFILCKIVSRETILSEVIFTPPLVTTLQRGNARFAQDALRPPRKPTHSTGSGQAQSVSKFVPTQSIGTRGGDYS